MKNLDQIKIELKALLPQGIPATIKALKELLPEGTKKYDEVLLLQSRFNDTNKKRLRNIVSDKDLQLSYDIIRSSLLDLIDSFTEADFEKNIQPSKFSEDKKVKKGALLHRIPSTMKVGEETRCVIRVAMDDDIIIENIELDEHVTLKSVRISDVMRVELLDPSEAKPFYIRALSSEEQFVDEDDYTEWQFVVKPLMEGTHSLLLKVSVIELIKDKERKREIVLEEKVVITTEAVQQEATPAFKSSGHDFAYISSAINEEAPIVPLNPLPPVRKSGLRRVALSLAALVLFASTTFAFTPNYQKEWWMTANTAEACQKYIQKYEDNEKAKKVYVKKAYIKKAEITEEPDDYRELIEVYPNAREENKVVKALEKLKPKLLEAIRQDTSLKNIKALSNYQAFYSDWQKQPVVVEKTEKLNTKIEEALVSNTIVDTILLKEYKVYFPQGNQVEKVETRLKEVNQIIQNPTSGDEPLTGNEISGKEQISSNTDTEPKKVEVVPSNTGGDNLIQDDQKEAPEDKTEEDTKILDNKENQPFDQTEYNMIFVKGGTFTMGCTEEQGDDCYDWEKPPHKVKLSGFYISKYEVTQRQWRAVMGSDPSELGFPGCDNCPVENVSWNDIQEFLQKLNQKPGNKYRLPTEAEWEYAARGGSKSQNYKYAGSNDIGKVAWYSDNSGFKTHEVGKKAPNELGLFDMSGNVWEWCEDDWHDDYEGAPKDGKPWKGAPRGSSRVFRGGSWNFNAGYCRVSYRFYFTPDDRNGYVGFRLARSL